MYSLAEWCILPLLGRGCYLVHMKGYHVTSPGCKDSILCLKCIINIVYLLVTNQRTSPNHWPISRSGKVSVIWPDRADPAPYCNLGGRPSWCALVTYFICNCISMASTSWRTLQDGHHAPTQWTSHSCHGDHCSQGNHGRSHCFHNKMVPLSWHKYHSHWWGLHWDVWCVQSTFYG